MRTVPPSMTTAWLNAVKGGDDRPVVRATILGANLKKFPYDTALATGGSYEHDRHRTGWYTSINFADRGPLRELRNIKSFTWTRSVDQDIATATLVLFNSELSAVGDAAGIESDDVFDRQGYYTYNRGKPGLEPNRWGFTDTGWRDIIVPDRLVRTYEGYGADYNVWPGRDPNLLPSGTWLIDKVTYTDDGEITLEMRDVGRMLLENIVFPPCVPYEEYPLSFVRLKARQVPGRDVTGGKWVIPAGTATSSNVHYVGAGIDDSPRTYVSAGGVVDGHKASHALSGIEGGGLYAAKYWLSTGQTARDDKVWWEVDLKDNTTAMNGLRIKPIGGPYRIYISLHNGTKWLGKRKIPYTVTTGGVDIEAGIPFVDSVWADRWRRFDVTLPRKYANIKKIRLTFTRLWDTGNTGDYPWKAGLDMVKIYTASNVDDLGFRKGTVLKVVGNYNDYTHIIKLMAAWGGFFWPPPESDMDFIRVGPGDDQTITYGAQDSFLVKGRVWGNLMRTLTGGVADLTVDLFDKKPFLDVINYVRDIVGFYFAIGEEGDIIWRMPNLWSLGNYVAPAPYGQRTRTRTTDVVVIDEEQTLLSYSTTLDSSQIRERIFVANSTGKFGTVIRGFTPIKVGFRRIAGWTDQRFETKAEARVMADLIAAQSMFNYKRSRVVIPGYPRIQVDDQVRIFERTTNETYYHYVLGITSAYDGESREWTYTLDTHWLGEDPADAWTVKVDELEGATQAYLNEISEGTNGGAD